MVRMLDPEMLDRDGVAALLGVKPVTVSIYRSSNYKDSFPPPAGKVGRSPYWRRADIEAWNATRPGRGNRSARKRPEPVVEPVANWETSCRATSETFEPPPEPVFELVAEAPSEPVPPTSSWLY